MMCKECSSRGSIILKKNSEDLNLICLARELSLARTEIILVLPIAVLPTFIQVYVGIYNKLLVVLPFGGLHIK